MVYLSYRKEAKNIKRIGRATVGGIFHVAERPTISYRSMVILQGSRIGFQKVAKDREGDDPNLQKTIFSTISRSLNRRKRSERWRGNVRRD